MQNNFEDQQENELPETLGELADIIEVFAAEKNKAKYKEAAEKYNEIAGKKIFRTTLQTQTKKETKMESTKTKTPAKKKAVKKAVKKAIKKSAPAKKAAAVKKADSVKKKKEVSNKLPIANIKWLKVADIDLGREGSKKREILSLWNRKITAQEIIDKTGYKFHTVTGAIHHAVRTTPYGVKGGKKKLAKK